MKKVVKKSIKKKMLIEDLASQIQQQFTKFGTEIKSYIDTKFDESIGHSDSNFLQANNKIERLRHYMEEKAKDIKSHIDNEMLDIREYINNENISLLASTQGQFSMIQMEVEKIHDEIKKIKLDLQNLTTKVNQLQVA